MKVDFNLNVKVQTNSKLSSLFAGTQDKCVTCKKTVYPIEKVIFHYSVQKTVVFYLLSLPILSILNSSWHHICKLKTQIIKGYKYLIASFSCFSWEDQKFSHPKCRVIVQEISIWLDPTWNSYDTFGSSKGKNSWILSMNSFLFVPSCIAYERMKSW